MQLKCSNVVQGPTCRVHQLKPSLPRDCVNSLLLTPRLPGVPLRVAGARQAIRTAVRGPGWLGGGCRTRAGAVVGRGTGGGGADGGVPWVPPGVGGGHRGAGVNEAKFDGDVGVAHCGAKATRALLGRLCKRSSVISSVHHQRTGMRPRLRVGLGTYFLRLHIAVVELQTTSVFRPPNPRLPNTMRASILHCRSPQHRHSPL